MLTMEQKQAAEAIVNIFETGSVQGDYGAVVVTAGDTGHLTYGRSQTTLASGNLYELVNGYCSAAGSRLGQRLGRFLDRLKARDVSLDADFQLKNLLRASADDPLMRSTQDRFFDKRFWQLAVTLADRQKISSALGVAITYDSTVHGSWQYIRRRTNTERGEIDSLGEKPWLSAYVETRRTWLANHRRKDLRKTVYRMDAFIDMIEHDFWDLPLPLVVRGHEISPQTLNAIPRGSFDGPPPGSRDLKLTSPLLRGLDVREVQLGLSESGLSIKADGWFGSSTSKILQKFQQTHNQPASGELGAAAVGGFLAAQVVA